MYTEIPYYPESLIYSVSKERDYVKELSSVNCSQLHSRALNTSFTLLITLKRVSTLCTTCRQVGIPQKEFSQYLGSPEQDNLLEQRGAYVLLRPVTTNRLRQDPSTPNSPYLGIQSIQSIYPIHPIHLIHFYHHLHFKHNGLLFEITTRSSAPRIYNCQHQCPTNRTVSGSSGACQREEGGAGEPEGTAGTQCGSSKPDGGSGEEVVHSFGWDRRCEDQTNLAAMAYGSFC